MVEKGEGEDSWDGDGGVGRSFWESGFDVLGWGEADIVFGGCFGGFLGSLFGWLEMMGWLVDWL